MIPVTVIITTKNEQNTIERCLRSVQEFDQVIVVDSQSVDKTCEIANQLGAEIVPFVWNKAYPKKRQWCLDHLTLKYDWIFFVDADEIVTKDMCDEIRHMFLTQDPNTMAGYFVTARYLIDGVVLRFGQPNRKIALLHRGRMAFPPVDDLDIPGMGEMEGHYQPVLKDNIDARDHRIGCLASYMLHDAMHDERQWAFRHEKYARWEAGMNVRSSWPVDPIPWREAIKIWLRASRYRPHIMFLVIYIGLLGLLDGRLGLDFALRRYRYYKLIQSKERDVRTT